MNSIPLFTILILCVIIAFMLADKKMLKEAKRKKGSKEKEDRDDNNESTKSS